VAEPDRDQAPAALTRPGADPGKRQVGSPPIEDGQARSNPVVSADPQAKPAERDSGGLSALVNLWNTAIIKRPARSKAAGEKPPGPPVGGALGPDVADQPVASSVPARVLEPEGRDGAAAGGASGEHNTGGLSGLLSRWDTGIIRRPARGKPAGQKPPDLPVSEALGSEVKPAEPVASSGPDQPKPPRTQPQSPQPKPEPAPVPDEASKAGGWLRGLAGRMTKKS